MPLASAGLFKRLDRAPLLQDPVRAEARLTDWLTSLDPASAMHDVAAEAAVRRLLLGLADHSRFLWHLATIDPERCGRLLAEAPELTIARGIEGLETEAWDNGTSGPALMRALRHARQTVALLVALADLGGVWTVERVTEVLTRFADAAVRTAVRALLREAIRTGKLHRIGSDLETGCGLVVLALGKQGAVELNYSSDIDLVVLFDPDAPGLPPDAEPSRFYVRLTQQLVRLM